MAQQTTIPADKKRSRKKHNPELSASPMGWVKMNEQLRETTSEATVMNMLRAELETHKRQNFLARIHARYNVLRCERERREIAAGTFLIPKH